MADKHVSHKKMVLKGILGDYTNARDSMEKTSRVWEIFVLARKFLFQFEHPNSNPNFSSDDCNHPKVINHKTHPSTFADDDSSPGDEEETNMIYQVLKIALPVLSGLFIIGLVIFYGYHYRTNYSQDCCTSIFHGFLRAQKVLKGVKPPLVVCRVPNQH